jgi:UDP-2-acetamido-2-deoxy-ribo-hexuluronate aminotransferase
VQLDHIACTNFFPSKPLGCYGDEGAIFTADPELTNVMRKISRYGQDKLYHHTRKRMNRRLDAPLKLEIMDDELIAKQSVSKHYAALFRSIKIQHSPKIDTHNTSNWAQCTVRISDRLRVQEKLTSGCIPSGGCYSLPLNRQPFVPDDRANLPEGYRAAEEVLSLPMYPYTNKNDIEVVPNRLIVCFTAHREVIDFSWH